jgi:hypothetical protein
MAHATILDYFPSKRKGSPDAVDVKRARTGDSPRADDDVVDETVDALSAAESLQHSSADEARHQRRLRRWIAWQQSMKGAVAPPRHGHDAWTTAMRSPGLYIRKNVPRALMPTPSRPPPPPVEAAIEYSLHCDPEEASLCRLAW